MAVANGVAQRQAHAHRRATVGEAPPRKDVGDRADQTRLQQADTDDESEHRTEPGGDTEERQTRQKRQRVDHAATHEARRLPHATADHGGGVNMRRRVGR